MKILVLLLFLVTITNCLAGSPWYYGSGEAVNLENKIGYSKNTQKIISGQVSDPTTGGGVTAGAGSLLMRTNGKAYVKNSATATDWLELLTSAPIPTYVQDVPGTTSFKTAATAGKAQITGLTTVETYIGSNLRGSQTDTALEITGNLGVKSGNLIVGPATGNASVSPVSGNIFIESNFEAGINNVTATVGTATSDGSYYFNGSKSLKIALSSQTANVTSTAYTPAGYSGVTTEVSCMIKSSLTTAQVCAVDFSGNNITCNNYDGSNIWKRVAVTFTNASVFKWRIQTSAAATGDIYVDDCYGGIVQGSSLSNYDQYQYYTISQAQNALTNATNEIEFNLGTATITTEGQSLFTVADDSGNTRTKFTANVAMIVDVALSGVANGAGDTLAVYKNGSMYWNGHYADASQRGMGGQIVTLSLAPGDILGVGTNGTPYSSGSYFFKAAIYAKAKATAQVVPATTGMESWRISSAQNAMTNITGEVQFPATPTVTKNGVASSQTEFALTTNILYHDRSTDPSKFYCSIACKIQVTAVVGETASTNNILQIIENGATATIGNTNVTSGYPMTVTSEFHLKKGEYFTIGVNTGSIANTATAMYATINVTAAETAFLAALPVNIIGSSYSTAAGQSIPNATHTIVDFGTKIKDDGSLVTTGASWKFTIPEDGWYHIDSSVTMASNAAFASTEVFQSSIYVDGTQSRVCGKILGSHLSVTEALINCSHSIYLNKGQYVDVRAYQDSGGASSLLNSANWNKIEITKLGFTGSK